MNTRTCILLLLLLAFTVPVLAQLPGAVGGQPLPSLAPMLERVTPAVVNISTEGHVKLRMNPLFEDPFFRRFFNIPDMPNQRKTQSLGSGVIVDASRGLVLTNHHVIANADAITVKLTDGREFKAKLIGADPETDLAVIQIKADKLMALASANSDALRVGDFVVAIGNPFGLGQTVTSGIVSALERSGLGITGYEDLIQTDASINPGNSGGALVNLRGELVGINTAIYSQSGGNIGIGFAIPINMAQRVMEQLVQFGEVNRGFLGAEMQNLTPDLAAAFGLPNASGAVLVNIVPGSPADKAGLRAGDVVVTVNDKAVRDATDLRNTVGLMRVGDDLRLDVLRDGKRLRVSAKVGARMTANASPESPRNERLAGLSVQDLGPEHPAYGNLSGVVVQEISPRSPAFQAGLRPGDVIAAVNNQEVSGVNEFVALVGELQGQLVLRVHRGNQAAFLVIK
ncbi:MAG: DegQ family serine endoprotease [Gammaproteobacteria bacterium]|nr:DegQ family serine endoprotease [Gammaproteobacteria bacterium]